MLVEWPNTDRQVLTGHLYKNFEAPCSSDSMCGLNNDHPVIAAFVLANASPCYELCHCLLMWPFHNGARQYSKKSWVNSVVILPSIFPSESRALALFRTSWPPKQMDARDWESIFIRPSLYKLSISFRCKYRLESYLSFYLRSYRHLTPILASEQWCCGLCQNSLRS